MKLVIIMNIASIIILVLFVVFLVYGLFQGFLKILLKTMRLILSLIISFFLAEPVGRLIFRTFIGRNMAMGFEHWLLGLDELFSSAVTEANQSELLAQGFTKLKIPSFLHDLLNRMIGNLVDDSGGATLAYYSSRAFGRIVCVLIAFIILSILSFIIFMILFRLIKKVNDVPVLGPINRGLGMLLSGALYVIVLSIILWGLALLTTISPEVNDFVIKAFDLNGYRTNVARWLYENNVAVMLYKLMMR